MKFNWIFVLPVSLLIASLAGCSGSRTVEAAAQMPNSVPDIAVVHAARQDLDRGIVVTGELTPFQEVEVMAKVAGYVRRMHVDVGDRVRQGQVLAELEIPEMTDDLTRAAAAIERNRADLHRAGEEIHRAQTAYEMAHLTYSRISSVAKNQPGLVAQQEIDDAQSRDQIAAAQVAAARSALVAAQEQIKVSEAEQSKLRTLMQYARVVAPFAGVITRRYANDGSMIQAGVASQTQAMPLVRLSQNSLLRVVLPVPESAAGIVRPGSEVEVRVPSLNKSFTGKVARTADRVDTSTRTMHTEVDVPNPGDVLIPGMFAEVSLTLSQSPHALAVPITAVSGAGQNRQVWIVDSASRLRPRSVQTGLETPDYIEITSGLREGDLVASAVRGSYQAGQMVRPQATASGSAKGGA